MLWLAAGVFGDEGRKTRDQLRGSLPQAWQLGIEASGLGSFAASYEGWATNGV
jgi:hypothetical protein